ncbi:MAG: hypothetical protein PVH84_12155 [Candidatus Aminicenantes bacterium]|jgi:hypothetical protein
MNNHLHYMHGPAPSRGATVFRIIGWTVMGVILAALFALVFGFVVKWLWNWLMPALFGLGMITYWQAFGIVILAKLIFGSLGGHHRDRSDHFRNKFHEKWHRPWGEEGEGSPSLQKNQNFHKYYKEFWRDEGEKAFEDYIRRIKANEQNAQKD